MRTPKTQVARTLRAQCPGHGSCCAHNAQVACRSRAQRAQVARSACAGRALSVRRSRAQRAQVARSACAGRALSVRRSRAQRAQVARSACAGRAHSAQVVGACRDLPALPSQTAQVATSWRPSHVATSHWCRDTAQPTPGRDFKFHVATPSLLPSLKPGRDTRTRS